MSNKYKQHTDNPKKRATHGLTVSDLDDHLENQVHNDVKKIKCNLNPDYEIALIEAHAFFHVMLEAPLFDTQSGKRLSTPKKRKFHIRQYHHMLSQNFFNGQKVEVLHDPERYNADIEARKKKEEKDQLGVDLNKIVDSDNVDNPNESKDSEDSKNSKDDVEIPTVS